MSRLRAPDHQDNSDDDCFDEDNSMMMMFMMIKIMRTILMMIKINDDNGAKYDDFDKGCWQ